MGDGNGFPYRSVRSFPSPSHSFPFLPFPCPFQSVPFRLGLSLGTYHLTIARVAFLLLIAGFDDRVKRFFKIVSPLGIAGMLCGCKACGHGKKKMKNYFHLFEEKMWTNPARLIGCSCRQQTRRRKH